MSKNKIYFASDFHLGTPNLTESHNRERLIITWLEEIRLDAESIYLLGDIFDFWFEYKKVIPKGFVRILGKLAEISDSGTQIHLFTGNHDLWMKDYLIKEIGVNIYYGNQIITKQNKKLFIGHGDGLGNGDYFYKILKYFFTSRVCRWAFSQLHPDLAFNIAHKWSRNNKKNKTPDYISDEKELILEYCKQKQNANPVDYYIFGHRHLPLELFVDDNATYINTGDWLSHNTYAVLENGIVSLNHYPN